MNRVLTGALFSCGIASGMLMTQAAHADTAFCESPWLKKGTKLGGTFSNAKGGKGTFKAQVLSVNKKAADSCDIKLNLDVTVKGDKFPVTANGDVNMNVQGDNAVIGGTIKSQALMNNSIQAKLDIKSNKHLVFKPMSKVPSSAGDLPAQYMLGSANGSVALANSTPAGQISIQEAYARTSGRKLSSAKSVKTALGSKQCQTIQYTADYSGGRLSIPALFTKKKFKSKTAQVTETYCPSLGITPKIVVGSGKNAATLEITNLNIPAK